MQHPKKTRRHPHKKIPRSAPNEVTHRGKPISPQLAENKE
jgi:hypothetical protein